MHVVNVGGRPAVFSWADGVVTPREVSLLEHARKGDEELLQTCLWLENQGKGEEAIALLDRILS